MAGAPALRGQLRRVPRLSWAAVADWITRGLPRHRRCGKAHHNGNVVGVSDDPPGETYWKVANGIRLSGMPSYKDLLTETQMWQVSLLLANAPTSRCRRRRWPF